MSADPPWQDPDEAARGASEPDAFDRDGVVPPSADDSHLIPPPRPEPPGPPVDCWRCGKQHPAAARTCPYCHARNKHAPLETVVTPRNDVGTGRSPITIVMWTFGLVLLTGLIHGAMAYMTLKDSVEITLRVARSLVNQIMFVEGFDTLLILGALLLCGRVPLKYRPTGGDRATAWLLAVPTFAFALGLNLAYHWAIREFTGEPLVKDELLQYPQLFNVLVVVICVQPAIVEELFMRYLFLGVLNQYMGTHGAVWVSAVAFGMIHLGQPLGIPYLIVLGGVLGYLRVASGGIVLPVLFHFAHNAAVVAIEVN